MAYAQSVAASRGHAIPKIPPRAKRGLLMRLLDAIEQANKQRAEREIARYLGGPGAIFTDETEREIERRFLSL